MTPDQLIKALDYIQQIEAMDATHSNRLHDCSNLRAYLISITSMPAYENFGDLLQSVTLDDTRKPNKVS